MHEALTERIRQTNPWLFGRGSLKDAAVAQLPPRWLHRRQVDCENLLRPGKAHLIVGPRQAGKSSLVWSTLRDLRRPLFVNIEEPVLRAWCDSPSQFLSDLSSLGLSPEALFLEEAQWLDGAGLFVKGLVDARPTFPILVTGSSSFHLADRTRESLAGRATRHVLLPFSLGEIVPPTPALSQAALELERRDALERLLRVGGYPEPWLSDQPETLLAELYQACILRDASDLFRVDRSDAWQRLLELAAYQIGNLVNVSELAALSGIVAGTVARYFEAMEHAHVLRLLSPYAGGKRREVTGARKAYFLDNGLRNAVLGRVSLPLPHDEERGALLENLVFSELAKALPFTTPIRHWRSRSGAEVDFVVNTPRGLVGIEVKAGPMPRPKLSRSGRSFIGAYSPQEFWILNETLVAEEEVEHTRVRWLPTWCIPEVCEETLV